jgi:hypothetical protein
MRRTSNPGDRWKPLKRVTEQQREIKDRTARPAPIERPIRDGRAPRMPSAVGGGTASRDVPQRGGSMKPGSPREGQTRVKMLMSNPPIKVTMVYRNGQWVEVSRERQSKAAGTISRVPARPAPGAGGSMIKPLPGSRAPMVKPLPGSRVPQGQARPRPRPFLNRGR